MYLVRMRETVRSFGIYTRNPAPYLCDSVVFGLLSKAFSLADAALILVESGHTEESFGLGRSIVECAFNLRYITQDRNEYASRALAFARFFFKERQFWLHHAKEYLTDSAMLAELDKFAKENAIVSDRRAASEHWSGLQGFIWKVCQMDHPLDGTSYTLKHRKIGYAIDYHQTSAYVHCSFAAIDGMLPDERTVYNPRWKSEGREQEGQRTLYDVLQYVQHAVQYALFAVRVEDAARVDILFRDALSRLHPIKRLHRP